MNPWIDTWESRYPQEREPIESAAAQNIAPAKRLLGAEDAASAADHFEWHDDKPSETACNMAVQTGDGDLTTYGSPLRQGR